LCEAVDFLVVLGVSELPISNGGCNPGNSTFGGSSVWLLNDSVGFGFVELVVSDEGNSAGENFLESVLSQLNVLSCWGIFGGLGYVSSIWFIERRDVNNNWILLLFDGMH
jgi:hypothetical protein